MMEQMNLKRKRENNESMSATHERRMRRVINREQDDNKQEKVFVLRSSLVCN